MSGIERAPKVTIGLPVYNGEDYLESSLSSMLALDYSNLEIVISDNASVDATQNICESVDTRNHAIRYSRNEVNTGGFKNNNRVIDLADGDYFLLAGHDDLREPTQVSRCVAILEAQPELAMCYCATVYIDAQGDRIDGLDEHVVDLGNADPVERFAAAISLDHKVEAIYGIYRMSAIQNIRFGLYPDSDRVFVAEAALNGPFHRLDEPLFFRRQHSNKSTARYKNRYDRTAWGRPGSGHDFAIPHLEQLFGLFRAVLRSRLSTGEKLRSLGKVFRWAFRYQRMLWSDVEHVLRSIVRRTLIFLRLKKA
ncbi:MAG: glycosyltransferase family 2 protein [Pseudomonadota bacterium]